MNSKIKRMLCMLLCFTMMCCALPATDVFAAGSPVIGSTQTDGLIAGYDGNVILYSGRQLSIVSMYRLYNPNSGEHFYSGSPGERDSLISMGWQYEGIAWNAPILEGSPVYRVFNPVAGDHHYTMSWEEVEMLQDAGWQYEGVAWNSADPNSEGVNPLYRLYNPNAFTGTHHYTGSEEERDYLVSLGWIYEGIGWFGVIGFQPGDSISRGQWIHTLISTCGYPNNLEGEQNAYVDIAGCEYRTAIEIAVAYGILNPEVGSYFNPYEPATREFAAETAVKCMGYAPTEAIVCTDAAAITNPAAAKQAVDSGLLSLESNHFFPQRILRNEEAQRILTVIEEEFNTSNGSDSETPAGYIFLEGITVREEGFDWTANGDTVLLPEGEAIPAVGEIIVFGTDKAIRVESVEQTGSGTVITYSSPELYEFLDSMNITGSAPMDFTKFIPAENVTVTPGVSQIQTLGFMDDAFDVPTTVHQIKENASLNAEVKLMENVKLVVNLDAAIPSVAYKFDIDFGNPFLGEKLANVKNAYVKLTEDINVHVEIVASTDNVLIDDLIYPPYIELGTIPLIGADGVGIVLEVDLVLSPEGKFELDYNVYGTLGVQVLDNQPKNISALQSSVSVGLAGAIKVGPQMKLLAEVFEKDLLSFSASAGIQGGGSVHVRSTGLVCMDAGITAYAEINAFEQCLLDDWLNIALKFTIWDQNNSPINISGHWENLVKVDECTYEQATIKGTVASADDRTLYIENAKIQILNHDTLQEQITVYSDARGNYTAVVPGGTYLVRVSADGYIPFESLETVGDHQIIYLETYLMVEGDEDSNETSTIGGRISNSVNGIGVPNVKLTIRKGWNKTTGEIVNTVYTDANGNYSAELPLGNFTIAMECSGYVSNHINVAVTASGNGSFNGVMNPDSSSSIALGDMRIILTWTDEPSDLDSHLWGPTVDGSGWYHIYFSNMSYYYDSEIRSFLDIDDVSYDGPETTTVYDMTNNGIYSFYVHNYTNKYDDYSTILANSGAKVQVYMGEDLIAQYHVPTSGVGTVWHVFDFDATTGIISGVNTFSAESSSSYVGSPYVSYGLDSISTEEELLKDYEIAAMAAAE